MGLEKIPEIIVEAIDYALMEMSQHILRKILMEIEVSAKNLAEVTLLQKRGLNILRQL